jgi:hypothetical protein
MMPVIQAMNQIIFINDSSVASGNVEKQQVDFYVAGLQQQANASPSGQEAQRTNVYRPQSPEELVVLAEGFEVIMEEGPKTKAARLAREAAEREAVPA